MVAHPEVDAPMSRARTTVLALLLLVAPTFLAGPAFFAGTASAGPVAHPASSLPVSGSISGPTLVSVSTTSVYQISGWGGPAVASNGTRVGSIRYFATPTGPNLTGVSFTPAAKNFTTNTSLAGNLTVGNASETITIDVMVSSTYQGKNQSTNFTYAVDVVRPYVITATIVNSSSATVSAFTVFVTLDGTVIGSVNVTSLLAGGTFGLSFKYPTLGLSPGDHTFAISLAQEHGLVTFSNGQTLYTQTVYVVGPAPDYTLWYVAGIVAFFGALFIFATRVAARRRGATRR